MAVIEVKNLKKNYQVYQKEPGLFGSIKSLVVRKQKTVQAVNNISFKINKGELVGFIGPNGAGKTTTLKCLSGLLHPDGGSVSVLDYQPWQRQAGYQKQFSLVMGQKNQLWWDLPPMETFLLNKEIYEISDKDYQKTLSELVDLLEVKEVLKVQVRKLSLGQRMKCELIAALLHSPQVLFLDEPTIGLDVVMQKKIRTFIKEYNSRFQATIILTSHYMSDVRELCQRVMIIDKGKLVFDGSLEKIIKKFATHKKLTVTFSKEIKRADLNKVGKVEKYNPPQAVIAVKREVAPIAAAQLLQKFPVVDLNLEEPPVEDIIRELFTSKEYA